VCTVSIVPLADGFRLMCNRDEQHARPGAQPPRWVGTGRTAALMPTDPQGGGSWVAVTADGFAVTLLNRLSPNGAAVSQPKQSRGELVTSLVSAGELDALLDAVHSIDPARYRAFQLVAVAGPRVLTATSDGARLESTIRTLDRPVVFTSSSLGDTTAERMRVPLFEALVVHADDPLKGQREFHAHRWPRCSTFSVLMCRSDARTVSRATIDVRAGMASLAYEPLTLEASCCSSQSH
jgi:hypothetical protein